MQIEDTLADLESGPLVRVLDEFSRMSGIETARRELAKLGIRHVEF